MSMPSLEPDSTARITDSPHGILGVNTIILSVTDLDAAVAFYQAATPFDLIKLDQVADDTAADTLFDSEGVQFRRAILRAPNMLIELLEFKENKGLATSKMPIEGPGMTHTCYQTPAAKSGYDRFKAAGADVLTIGDTAIDLGGYGVTYAYAHDPDGNMLEMEQLDPPVLDHMGVNQSPVLKYAEMWVTQVCLVSSDIDRLLGFYAELLGIAPSRRVEVKNNKKAAAIGGASSVHILGAWFQLDTHAKVLELWQYLEPKTPAPRELRSPISLGYSYVLEVDDINREYQRLRSISGVSFMSEPVVFDDFIGAYARDIDGNVLCLRQLTDPNSLHSVRALDL
jgi:catechol 2,3-dioxygenase-like lactoylglutathione lyase family enzyme